MREKSTLVSAILISALALLNMTNLNSVLYTEYPELVSEGRLDRIFELREKLTGLSQLVGLCGTVGYVSDLDDPKESSEFLKQRGLLQYAITPIAICPDNKSKFVIGNFFKSQAPHSIDSLCLRLFKTVNKNLVIYIREGD